MDDNSFGARLAAARRAAGYNQTEVAKYITEAGFPVRTQAVSKWERGTTLPSARQLVELCRSTGWRYPPVRASCSTGRITTPSRSATRYRRTRTSACALPGTAWSRALFTGRSSGCIARKRSAPARSACSSITARGTASGSSALRGAWSLCRSTRGMPPSVWRKGTSCAYLGVSSADLQFRRGSVIIPKISMRLFKRKRSPAYATHGSGAVAEYGLRGL